MLSLFHKPADLIMVSDQPKGHSIRQFKDDPIVDIDADFPIIFLEILQAQPGPQGPLAVQIGQNGFNRSERFLLSLGGELFESAVKAGLELKLH